MKATGIARKLDGLGRIVLPMELRKSMNIKTGDLIEIFIGDDHEVILKKYASYERINDCSRNIVNTLADMIGKEIAVCDSKNIIFLSNNELYRYERLPDSLRTIIKNGEKESQQTSIDSLINEKMKCVCGIVPIMKNNTFVGSMLLIGNENSKISDSVFREAETVAKMLGRLIKM